MHAQFRCVKLLAYLTHVSHIYAPTLHAADARNTLGLICTLQVLGAARTLHPGVCHPGWCDCGLHPLRGV